MSDFIIREASSENARGPFTLEELRTLSDSGQISRETLYYVEGSESWEPLESNTVVKEAIFPEKNRLTLRKRKSVEERKKELKSIEKSEKEKRRKAERKVPTVEELLAEAEGEDRDSHTGTRTPAAMATGAAIGTAAAASTPAAGLPESETPAGDETERQTVYTDKEGADLDKLLAAAEGQTADTAYLARRRRSKELAYGISTPVLTITLLLLCFSFFYPIYPEVEEAVRNAEPQLVVEQPTIILALVDLILAISIGLAATEVYPVLRARSIIAMGFFGIIFYSFENWPLFWASITVGIGMYILTLSARFWLSLVASILALGGAALFAFAGFHRVINIG